MPPSGVPLVFQVQGLGMKKRFLHNWIILLCGLVLLLAGCAAAPASSRRQCQIVLEQSGGFTADRWTAQVSVGSSVSFALTESDGYTITGADYAGAQLVRTADGVRLILPDVRYPAAVRITVEQSEARLFYHANGGQRLDGGEVQQWVEVPVTDSHLRWNTEPYGTLFQREGYTLTGWNTQADGSGTAVGLGSRTQPESLLYAQWAKWNEAEEFVWEQTSGGVTITGWNGSSQRLVIPAQLGGKPVVGISAGAFAGAVCTEVVLPEGLRRVEPDAFTACAVQSLTVFDSIQTITDHAFAECDKLHTLHINAVRAPVYSGGYQSTWADKYDYLSSLQGQKKLVLFSGSSARFGYDSTLLEAAFPEYKVVNMGVFAYTNALPQLDLIADFLEEGDILLLSPEFDAAKRQFCTTNSMDEAFFALMEADYDQVSLLDLRQYQSVLSAFGSYLQIKSGMSARSYGISPADFDEDGVATQTKSYNVQGDYILYRPDAEDDTPIYGLGVEYTVQAFPQSYLDSANAAWQPLLERGIRVYLTYSPRNSQAVSADTTPESIAGLDEYLRAGLCVQVISPLEQSLMPGRYFYGTDNHLSTNGVQLRTEQVIADLLAQWEKEELR